jgi:uncharacterized protein (TIGR02996 family)
VSVVRALLAAIEADPTDEASRLVIADHLQAEGDPRGDLIVLDHAERRGLVDSAAALDQLLLLAAEYTFPRAEPDEPVLAFEQTGEWTFQVVRGATTYELERDGDWWVMNIRSEDPDDDRFAELNLTCELDARCFRVLSDAILAHAPLDELRFEFETVHLPQYDGGPLRCYQLPLEFLIPRVFLRNRFGLAARDYHRWHGIWRRLRAMQPPEDEG